MSLEIKRKEVELMRVQTARFEIELRIAERKEEIERLENNIRIQIETETRLSDELKKLKEV